MKMTAATLTLLLAMSQIATGQDESLRQFGVLKLAASGKITLQKQSFKKNNGESGTTPERTLVVAPDAKITVQGKAAKLEDLKANQGIWYRVDKDMKVVEIEFTQKSTSATAPSGFHRSAKLKSIENGKLVIEGMPAIKLAKDVKVKVGKKDANLKDLKLGETVSFDVEGNEVVRIEQRATKANSYENAKADDIVGVWTETETRNGETGTFTWRFGKDGTFKLSLKLGNVERSRQGTYVLSKGRVTTTIDYNGKPLVDPKLIKSMSKDKLILVDENDKEHVLTRNEE